MTTQSEIVTAALRVATPEELASMPEQAGLGFLHAVGLHLQKSREPTDSELEGLKELATDHLWHPALGAYSPKR